MKTKIITLLTILTLVSCGTRKTSTTKIEEKLKTETQTEIVDKSETQIDKVENSVTIDTTNIEETTITPIDNTKPFVINGKTFLNAKITTKKEKKHINTKKETKSKETTKNNVKTKVKAKVNNVVKQKEKQTERKLSIFDLWWLIVVILCGLGIYKFRKELFLHENR